MEKEIIEKILKTIEQMPYPKADPVLLGIIGDLKFLVRVKRFIGGEKEGGK